MCKVNIDIFSVLAVAGYSGTDINLKISLLEYGLLVRDGPLNKGYISIIAGVQCDVNSIGGYYDLFDSFSISRADLNNFFAVNSWADKKKIFSFAGYKSLKDWRAADVARRLLDLITYYGCENVFGISYNPVGVTDLLKFVL